MRPGLHARLATSYLGATLAAMVALEILVALVVPTGRYQFVRPMLLLLLAAPVGTLVGLLTTRGLVRRLRRVAAATARVAAGDLSACIPTDGRGDMGQLEQHFNVMTEHLVASMARQHVLAARNARLEERTRFSRDVHDAISQDLFSLTMLAAGVQASRPADTALQPQLAALESTATRLNREMRALLLELRPAALDDRGLDVALDELATAYGARLGIAVTTQIAPVALSAPWEEALLRIAQEALSNAVRHAAADAITLTVLPRGEGVEVTVVDNGCGFSPDGATVRHGLGLRLMRERVDELEGTMSVDSTPTQGTCVRVFLPCGETDADATHCHRG